MLHWHSMLILLLLVLSSGIYVVPVTAAPTSSGPTSPQEAQILWEDGEEAFEDSRFQDAINKLERYIDRYPGEPNYSSALYYLGSSFLEMKQTKEAIPVLKSYLTHQASGSNSLEARLALCRAYLAEKHFDEGLLTLAEIDSLNTDPTTSQYRPIHIQSLLLRSKAWLGKKQEDRAVLASRSAEKQLTSDLPLSLRGQVLETKIQLKTLECARLSIHAKANELQAKDQIERRGACLIEALLDYQPVLATEHSESVVSVTRLLKKAFADYYDRCINPPPPLDLKDRKRTPKELKRYRDELANYLVGECRKKYSQAQGLLKTWDQHLPPTLQQSIHEIQTTLSRLGAKNA